MTEPIIASGGIAAVGGAYEIHEWRGSGPEYLHVHYADDETWHVLEGVLTFRFADRTVDAPAGATVFVPAGVAHAYWDATGDARYLIILTPRLSRLIAELHTVPISQHGEVLRRYDSAMVDE